MTGQSNTLVDIEEFVIRDNGWDDYAWGGDEVEGQERCPFFTYQLVVKHPILGDLPLPNRPARPWDSETWPLGVIGDETIIGLASAQDIIPAAAASPIPDDEEPLAFPLSPLPEITGPNNQPRSGAFKDDFSQPGSFKRFEFKNLLPEDSGQGEALTGKNLLNTFLSNTFDRWLTPPDHETAAGHVGEESSFAIDPITGDRIEHFIQERTEFRQDHQLQVAQFLDISGEHSNTSWQELLDQMRLSGLDTDNETDCIFATKRFSYQPPVNPDTFVNFRSYVWVQYLQNSLATSTLEPINGTTPGASTNFAPVTISINSTRLTVSDVDVTAIFAPGEIVRVRGEQFSISAVVNVSTLELNAPFTGAVGSAVRVPLGLTRPIYYVQEPGDFISNGWTENNYWTHREDTNDFESALLIEGTFLKGEVPIIELDKDVVVTGSFGEGQAPQVTMWPLEYIDEPDGTGLPTNLEFDNGVGDWDILGWDLDFAFNVGIVAASAGASNLGAFFAVSDVTTIFASGVTFNVIDSPSGINDGFFTVDGSSTFNSSTLLTRIPVVEPVASSIGGGRMLSTSSTEIGWDNETEPGVLRQGIVPSFQQPVLEYNIAEQNLDETPVLFDEDLRIRAQKTTQNSDIYIFKNGLIDSFFTDFPREGRLLAYATQFSDSEHILRSMWVPTKVKQVAPTQNSEGEWNVAENFNNNIEKENPLFFDAAVLRDHFRNILVTSASAAQDPFRDGRNWRNFPDKELGNGGIIFQYEHNLDWWLSLLFQEDSDPSTVLEFAREESIRRNDSVRGIIERLANDLADRSQVVTQPQFRALILEEIRTLQEGVVPNPFFDTTNGLPNFIATPAHFGLFLAEEPGFVFDHIQEKLAYRGILGEIIDLPFGTNKPDTLDLIFHDIQTFLFESVPTRFRRQDFVLATEEDRIGKWDIENLFVFSGDGTTGIFTLDTEVEGGGASFISVINEPDDFVWARAQVELVPGASGDIYSLALNDKVIFIPQASVGVTGNDIANDFIAETKHAIIDINVGGQRITVGGDKTLMFASGNDIDVINSTGNNRTFEIQSVFLNASSDTELTVLVVSPLNATVDGSVKAIPELNINAFFDSLLFEQDPTRGTVFTLDIVSSAAAPVTIFQPIIPGNSAVLAASAFTTVASNLTVIEVPTPTGGSTLIENDDFILLSNKRDLAFSLKAIPASGLNNLVVVEFAFGLRKFDAERPPTSPLKIIPGDLIFDINDFVFFSPDDETLVRCLSASDILEQEERRFLKWTQRRLGGFIQELSEPFTNVQNDGDPFTWNYKDEAAQIPAIWYEIYCKFFGTSGPQYEPWVVQGYSQKPGFWELDFPRDENGLYPFPDMWQRIQDGEVQLGRLGIGELDGGVIDPDNNLPINFTTGSILPPFSSDFNSVFASIPSGRFDDFIFGDNAPAEKEWRDTLDFRWDTVEIGYTLKPIDFISLAWDAERLRLWKDCYTYDGATGRKTTHKEMVFFGENEDLIATEKNFSEFNYCADASAFTFGGQSFIFSPIEFFEGNGQQKAFTLERGFNDGDFSLVQVEASILIQGSVVGSVVTSGDYGFLDSNTLLFASAPGAGTAFIGNEWDCSIDSSATASIVGILTNASAAASSFDTHFPASTFNISGSTTTGQEITLVTVPEGSNFTASGTADFWRLNSIGGAEFYVWFNITDGSTVDPAASGTGLQVDTTTVATAVNVASNMASVIGADAAFTASATSDVVTITTVASGANVPDAFDVTASVTISVFRQAPGTFTNTWNFGASPLTIGASNAQVFRNGSLLASASFVVLDSSNIEVSASVADAVEFRIGAFEITGDFSDDFLAGIIGASSGAGGGIEFEVISSTGNDGPYVVGPVDSVFSSAAGTTVIPVLASVTSTVADGSISFTESCITDYGWDIVGWDDSFAGDPVPIKVKLGSPGQTLNIDANDTVQVFLEPEEGSPSQLSANNFTISVSSGTVTLDALQPEFTIVNLLVFNPLSIREKDFPVTAPKRINGVNQWFTQFYKARGRGVGIGTEYDLRWKNWNPRVVYRTDHILNADSVIAQALSIQLERNTDFVSEIDKTQGIRDFFIDALSVSVISKTESSINASPVGFAPTTTVFEVDNFDFRRNSVTTAIARQDEVFSFAASALSPSQIIAGSTIVFTGSDLNGSVLAFRSRDEISVIIDGSTFVDSLVNVREQEISLTASALTTLTASSQAQILIEPPTKSVFSQSTDKEFIQNTLIVDDVATNTFVKGTVNPTEYIQPLEFEADSTEKLATKEVILPVRFTGAQALFTFLSEHERFLLEQGGIFDFSIKEGEDIGEFNDWTLARKRFIRFVDRLELYFNDPTQKPQTIKLNTIDIVARLGTTCGLVAPLESDSDFFSKKSQSILDLNGFLIGPKKTQVLRNDNVTSLEVIPGSTTRRFLRDGEEFTPKFVQSVNPLEQGTLVLNGEIWFDTINELFFAYDSDTDIFIAANLAEEAEFIAIIEPLTIHTIHWVIDNYEHIIRFNNETSTGRRIYDPLTGRIIDRINLEFERTRQHFGRPSLGGFVINRDDNNNLIVTRNIEAQVQGHRDLYDVYRVPLDNRFDRAIPEILGLKDTPYLDGLVGGSSRRTQIGFHQGFIQQKGARDNIDAFTKGIRSLRTFKIEEVFAFKIGEFGEKKGNDFVKVKITEREGSRNILGLHFTDTSRLEPADAELIEILENDPERFTDILDRDSTNDSLRFFFPSLDEKSVFPRWEEDFVQTVKGKSGNTFTGISGEFGSAISSTSAAFDSAASTFVTGSTVSTSSFIGVDFGTRGPGGTLESPRIAALSIVQGPSAATGVQVQFSATPASSLPASSLTWENIGSAINLSGVDGKLDKIILPQHTTSARFWRIVPTEISSSNWDIRSLEFHKYRPLPDYEKIGKVGAFNNKTIARVAAWYPWDPAEGVHPPSVDQFIDNQTETDPALYNFTGSNILSLARLDTDRAWGEEHVGETWWDMSLWETIDYKDERRFTTAAKRAANWGRLSPGKKVAVYEWIRSEVRPDVHDELVKEAINNPGALENEDIPDGDVRNLTDYTRDIIVQDDGTQKIFYYFWVTNRKRRGFTKQGSLRTLTISQIAAGLEDPNTLTENKHYHTDTFLPEGVSSGEGGWDGAEWDFSGWDLDVGTIPDRFTKWFGNRGDLVYVNDNIELQFERHFLLTGNPDPAGGILGTRHEEWQLIRRNQNERPPDKLWDEIVRTATDSACEFQPGVDNAKNTSCFMDQGDLIRILNKRIVEIKPDFIPTGFEAISPISEASTPTFEEGTPFDGAASPVADPESMDANRDIGALGEPTQIFITADTPTNTSSILARNSDLSFYNVASANQVTELFFDILEAALAGNREREDIFKTSWVTFDIEKELVQDDTFTGFNTDINLALEFLNDAGKPFHTHVNEEFGRTVFTATEDINVEIIDDFLTASGFGIEVGLVKVLTDEFTVAISDSQLIGLGLIPASSFTVGISDSDLVASISMVLSDNILPGIIEQLRIDICHESLASQVTPTIGGSDIPGSATYIISGSAEPISGSITGVSGSAFSDIWNFASTVTEITASTAQVFLNGSAIVPAFRYVILDASNIEIDASAGETVELRLGTALIGQPTTNIPETYRFFMLHDGTSQAGSTLPDTDPPSEDWFRHDGESFASNGTGYNFDGVGALTTSSINTAAVFIRALPSASCA